MSELISVVVPALNEAKSLPELYDRVRATLEARGAPFEFIVVDDGSSDGTFETARALAEAHGNVVGVRHALNHGKSMALSQGFKRARGDVAIMMDADLQDLPEAIPLLLDKLDEGYDLVNGWRKRRQDPTRKVLVSRAYNLLIKKIFGLEIRDVNCGLKAMRRDVYKGLRLRGDLHRLIPVIAQSQGFRCAEAPVPHADRKYGASRYKLLRHRGLLDVIALAASNSTQLRPFHVFSELGFLFILLSLLAGLAWTFLPTGGLSGAIGVLGTWALFVGTLLPLFGFVLETLAAGNQSEEWRDSLVRETIEPRRSDARPIRRPEELSQAC